MRTREKTVPQNLVELLRFCVVAFLAGVGHRLASGFGGDERVIGIFDAPSLGVVLGAATGYVLGGIVARLTFRTVSRTERALSGRSAEQLLAGLTGAVGGVMLAAALTWPMLLVGSTALTAPIFVFVLITLGSLGYRVGLSQRDGVLSMLGGSGRLGMPRAAASALPMVIDTSVTIDGRVLEVVRSGFLHGHLVVPEPVLGELQRMADDSEDQRRAKGRRGLDVLEALRQERGVDLEVIGDEAPDTREVDAKLVHICLARRAALLTLDTNLARVATVAGCRVLNLHALTLSLRPPVAAGERISLHLTRAGKEPGQAVGYLDDGTMVVVDRSRDRVGQDVDAVVTSVLLTANGRMVFAKPLGEEALPRQRAAEITMQIAAAARRPAPPAEDDRAGGA
ncbi:MAG: hypothetical protein JNL54_08405 [Kineosporiaceae bacterium]|nr:hypothetical protein [Kineosporiaceae bacterium]